MSLKILRVISLLQAMAVLVPTGLPATAIAATASSPAAEASSASSTSMRSSSRVASESPEQILGRSLTPATATCSSPEGAAPCDSWKALLAGNASRPKIWGLIPIGTAPADKCSKQIQSHTQANPGNYGAAEATHALGSCAQHYQAGQTAHQAALAQWKTGKSRIAEVGDLALQGIASADYLLGEGSSLDAQTCVDAEGLPRLGSTCRTLMSCRSADPPAAKQQKRSLAESAVHAWLSEQAQVEQLNQIGASIRMLNGLSYGVQEVDPDLGVREVEAGAPALLEAAGFSLEALPGATAEEKLSALKRDPSASRRASDALNKLAGSLQDTLTAFRAQNPLVAKNSRFMESLRAKLLELPSRGGARQSVYQDIRAKTYPSNERFLKRLLESPEFLIADGEVGSELSRVAIEAFDDQLKSTREALRTKLPEIRHTGSCLMGKGLDCTPERLSMTLEELEIPSAGSSESSLASALDDPGQCLWNKIETNQKRKELAQGLALDIGISALITVGTLGAGSEVAIGRLGTALARTGASVQRLQKFGRGAVLVGDSLATVQAGGAAVVAAQRLASGCHDELSRIRKPERMELGCPSATAAQHVQVTEAQSCLADAMNLAFSSLGAASGSLSIGKRLANRATVRAAASGAPVGKATLGELQGPGSYAATTKSGEKLEIVVASRTPGEQHVQAYAGKTLVGELKSVYDQQAGIFHVNRVDTALSANGRSYRNEGINSLMFEAALRDAGGASKFKKMPGLLTEANAESFLKYREGLLTGDGPLSLAKNPRLAEYLKAKELAQRQSRSLTARELEEFSSEIALDAAINKKAFSEGTAAGKVRTPAGFAPDEVEIVPGSDGKPKVRFVARSAEDAKAEAAKAEAAKAEAEAAKALAAKAEAEAEAAKALAAKAEAEKAETEVARAANVRAAKPEVPKGKSGSSSPWSQQQWDGAKQHALTVKPAQGPIKDRVNPKSVELQSVEGKHCPDCPTQFHFDSTAPGVHVKDHLIEPQELLKAPDATTFFAQKFRKKKHVTSLFPPGVAEDQLVSRLKQSSVKLKDWNYQSATYHTEIELRFYDVRSGGMRSERIAVEFQVCRAHCSHDLKPGDIYSIYPAARRRVSPTSSRMENNPYIERLQRATEANSR